MEAAMSAIVLAVCLLLALRLVAGEHRRRRTDRWIGSVVAAALARVRRAIRWRSLRNHSAREAEAVIRRARGGRWDGNVYRARSFRRPRKRH